jgi:membrane protein implicated in regulation of membrane protease activity
MDNWLIWMIAAVVLGAAEMFVGTFYLLWLGISCLIAGLVGMFMPDALWLQLNIASVVAVVLTLNTKKITKRLTQTQGFIENPIDALIGKPGIVLELPEQSEVVVVKVGSEIWSAKCGQTLQKGDHITVTGGHSTILEVQKQ